MQFTKLFNSILDSTIWQEPLETKVVWITMLAMSDRNGEVHASVPGLARRAGVTIQQCNAALACLESPDEYSRTKDHEGRRIREVDGGWELLNHGKYRALLSAEERKEYNRRKQAEYREGKRKGVIDASMTVNDSQSQSAKCTHTEAEAEAEAEVEAEPRELPKKPFRENKGKSTIDDLRSFVVEIGLPASDGESMFHHWEANGWKNGPNPVKDWKAGIRKWKSQGYRPAACRFEFQGS
jgi:hypothetical protein